MSQALKKSEAHKIVDEMPAGSTWEDLIHRLYVRESIERGLADSDEGRTAEVREVRAKYGLPE